MQRARPIMRTRSPMRVIRRRRRWNRVSWWYSALLVVPVAFIFADLVFGWSPVGEDGSSANVLPVVTFRIADAESGQPIAGVEVRAGTTAATSDDQGLALLAPPAGSFVVTVRHAAYEPIYGHADDSIDREQTVSLRRLSAELARQDDAQENPGRTEDAVGGTDGSETGGAAAPAATTAGAVDGGSGESELTGVVVAEDGEPIRGATVAVGDVRAKTRRDGTFRLRGAANEGELLAYAPGYADRRLTLPSQGPIEIALARQQINALYLSGINADDAELIDHLIQLADETEVNALVVDIKEVKVWYDTEVQFFHDAKAVQPTYDPRELVQRLHDHGIYAIARSVVFNDPVVAENRPDLAVKDESGEIWRGWDGGAWVNPFNEELWQPNIDLAVEAAAMGFDEIQYDYIRFPSDGDLTTAEFGPNYTEDGRVAAIVDFLKLSKKALEPTGAKLAVDIFGIVAIYPDDQGIGQRLADIAPVVDYVCPMIYPSHFNASSIDVGGEPNDLPFETIELSLALAKEKMPGMELKLRPWLQDFDLGREYTADDVRAQIRATDEAGVSGWLLWNAANVYTDEALAPES